jgi:hypothetical protein
VKSKITGKSTMDRDMHRNARFLDKMLRHVLINYPTICPAMQYDSIIESEKQIKISSSLQVETGAF